jgi:hypothetical protein
MPDSSFTGWHVSLFCDHPHHELGRAEKGYPDIFDTGTLYKRRADYVSEYRRNGWIFHRDGRLTCPDCAKALSRFVATPSMEN